MDPNITRISHAGRPPDDLETRSEQLKVRIDPYLNQRINRACKMLGISRAGVARQGLLLYLDHLEKNCPELRNF